MTRVGLPALLAGCTFLPDTLPGDFDLDRDGVVVQQDCNDDDPAVGRLEALAGPIGCGDTVDGAFDPLRDFLDVYNCNHETDPKELITVWGPELSWFFAHDVPTDVRVTVDGVDAESRDHYLLANVGPWCTVDTCVMGTRADDSVDFYARPNEGWYIVLGRGRLEWDFTLHVDCTAP